MIKNLRLFVGLAIIGVALMMPQIKGLLPTGQPSVVEILQMEKPEQDLIDSNLKLKDIVTDSNDREAMAVFNYEFARRVPNYTTNLGNLDKIYASASVGTFGNIKDKYPELGKFIIQGIQDNAGDKDALVTEDERKGIAREFYSYAWILGGGE